MYPFSAIVGQDQLKLALLICAVNPSIGGLLISGDKGTAKSTAVRGLPAILPQIDVRSGCHFNCEPHSAAVPCADCLSGEASAAATTAPTPVVNLPVGATEDRVIGSLDFERALRDKKRAFQPGLLASAHRGILYIDEVNLLPDHLVDVLLDVSASGINTVERESMTLSHPAKFTLIGSMNPEEGELRPQFLDRFAMMVSIQAPNRPEERAEVVRRRIDFDRDPQLFVERWKSEELQLAERICEARRRLAVVHMLDDTLNSVSALCAELQIKSLRADIFIHKVACTIAALSGRSAANSEDIRQASELVLVHRMPKTSKKSDPLDQMQDKLDQMFPPEQTSEPSQQPVPPEPQSKDTDQSPDPQQESEEPESKSDSNGDANGGELLMPVAPVGRVATLETVARSGSGGGKRSQAAHALRGSATVTVQGAGSNIAIDATIRHAITRSGGDLNVERKDLHHHRKTGKRGNLIILVVDASGSMAAMQRMKMVKGTALALLEDAYQRRDKVAMIAFRDSSAELLLPPTRSTMQAQERLAQLPTGGMTPLAHGLASTLELTSGKDAADLEPLVVLLTDGRANVALTREADPWSDALELAGEFQRRSIAGLVLDTESGAVKLGRAGLLAEHMSADCMPLEDISAPELRRVILGKAGRTAR